MGFEQSCSTVSALVKNFQANEKYYSSPENSEIDVRRDFIDQLIYQLYGLTEEEIRIAEESVGVK